MDKRLYHLTPRMQEYYKGRGEWDKITRCSTHSEGMTVSVHISERRDTWRHIKRDSRFIWEVKSA